MFKSPSLGPLRSGMITLPIAMVAALMLTQPPSSTETPQRWTFDNDASLTGWELSATGDASKRMPKPKLADGKLLLLESWSNSTAVAAVPAPEANAPFAWMEWSFTIIMNTGTEGLGLAWLDTSVHGVEAKAPTIPTQPFGPGVNDVAIKLDPWGWEAPNFARGFGVGFDASNPPNRDPFKGSGNAYDRPQHEISLHWDGMEIIKKTTSTEFRDEKPHAVVVRVEFVVGGANVSVKLDTERVFERVFIAELTPFAGRTVFGARNGPTAGDVLIDDLSITHGDKAPLATPPMRVTALDRVINDKDHGKNEAMAEFPADTSAFGRIICTLRLDKPEKRFDPWDRTAHIFLVDDAGETFELVRYITPYHRGHEWKIDVTDLRPLLTGKKKIIQECGTQGEGWVVSVHYDFYPGPCERRAIKVINLWSGAPEIGNPDKPVSAFYTPRSVPNPSGATGAKVRTIVTGHGMSPNTDNAAEFMSIGRTLTVNGVASKNTLWKTDNYLNPCRPQGGTWKYDRAGWAPGDVVRPWEVDATAQLAGAKELKIEYSLDAYENRDRGKTWAPNHRTEAQVIFYEPGSAPAAPAANR